MFNFNSMNIGIGIGMPSGAGGVGGVSPFTPSDMTTVGWWDASDTSPTNIIESGGLVSQLTDIGTNESEHLVQVTGSAQMSTGLQTINGLNVLSNETLGKHMESLTFPIPSSGNVSISFVARIDGQNPQNFAALISMDASSNDWQLETNNASQFNGKLNVSNIGSSDTLTGGPFTGPDIWSLVFDFDSGTKKVYTNGIERSSGTYTAKINASQSLRVFINRGVNNWIYGLFGEMVVYEDGSQVSNVESYLTDKWIP